LAVRSPATSFLAAKAYFGYVLLPALNGASAEYPLWEFLVGLGWSKSFSKVVKLSEAFGGSAVV